jgi:integrase
MTAAKRAASGGLAPSRVRSGPDTRRTCASLLRELGVHPRVAMQILRHSRISLTMDIYTDVPDPATREALGKLSAWLDQADAESAATGQPGHQADGNEITRGGTAD